MSKHFDKGDWVLLIALIFMTLISLLSLFIILAITDDEDDKEETVYITQQTQIAEVPTKIIIDREPEKELAWDWATPSSALEEPKKAIQPVLAPALLPVGGYELTAYIATGNPCADGVYPSTWWTAACNDPALWHKTIHIEGYGDFYVHDTGGMASNVIDIFVGSYDEAINFGRRYAEVYVYE